VDVDDSFLHLLDLLCTGIAALERKTHRKTTNPRT
jgi:hypothetical protein